MLCSTTLSEETAILYAHLEKTQTRRYLTLIDTYGHSYRVEIDHTPFFIQKAGELFLEQLHEQRNPQALIQSAIAVYRSIQAKGFTDHDSNFHKNLGVCNNQVFIIDVGKVTQKTSSDTLEKMTVSLRDELALHYPHLLPYYKKILN